MSRWTTILTVRRRCALRPCAPLPRGRPGERAFRPGPVAANASLERGHHLLGEDLQAPHLGTDRQEAARIQLGRDPRQPQLLAQLTEPILEPGRRAERDLGLEDLVVREAGELPRLGLASVDRPHAGAPD